MLVLALTVCKSTYYFETPQENTWKITPFRRLFHYLDDIISRTERKTAQIVCVS